jgi:hypothetical protein
LVGVRDSWYEILQKDLRLRALAAVERGMPRAGDAQIFGVPALTIRRYLSLRRETRDVEPKAVPKPGAQRRRRRDKLRPGTLRM